MKRKFKVGQRAKYRDPVSGKWIIVTLTKRDTVLPELWFECSNGYLKRVTMLWPLTKRERKAVPRGGR